MTLRDKLKFWILLSNYIEKVVQGTSPLSLPDAIADSLYYVKAFGGTEQRNLPIGYTLLDYIESAGTQYIDLGYKGNENTKVEVKFKYHTATSATGSGRVFGSRTTSSSNAFAIGTSSGVVSATGNKVFWCYDAQSFFVIDDPAFPVGDWQTVVFSATEHTLNGVSYGDDYNVVEFETPQNLKLFGFDNNGTMGYGQVDVAYCKVWDNGVLIRDLVPCKNASNVIGMYDRANNQFYDNDGTGDFVAGSAVVPTPDRPIDIVCNNGKLVVRDNELPVAYKRLKDITFDSEVYYVTDTYLTGADTTSFTINATESARNVLGCYTGSGSGNNVSFYLNIAGTGNYVRYKGSLYRPMINDGGLGQDYTLSITPTGTTGFDTNVTWTEQEFTCPDKLYIGWLPNATSPKFLGTFKGNITVSNRANFVPCERVSDGAIGYYDTYSETFFENQGTGTPTTSGYDYTHNTVVADGTVETINAHGKNLFDQSTATRYRTSWTASGYWQVTSDSSLAVTYGSYVKPNTTYTLSKKGGNRLIIIGYRTKTEPSSSQATPADYKIQTDITAIVDGSYTFTTPADCTWILFGLRQNNSTPTFPYDVQLEQGSTATEYETYYDGGTATAEMLLKVGDYQDVQSILDGVVTRKVGVKVLDGTEEWRIGAVFALGGIGILKTQDRLAGTSNMFVGTDALNADMPDNSVKLGPTSYTGWENEGAIFIRMNDYADDLSGFKSWLAAQYAAGTPVIVIYPLATATTESVAGQTLQVQAGDNTLEITQASLNNLELECKYKKQA